MKDFTKKLSGFILLSLIFIVGVSIGLLLWNKITLPFHNPWGIVGTLAAIKYNPTNDSLRFLVFILSPLLLLTTIFLLKFKRFNEICFDRPTEDITPDISGNQAPLKQKILAGVLVICTVLVALNLPNYLATPNNEFDPFHDGESLGPAMSYMAGQTPYKDFVFLHGLFENPLRSVVAFKLFGKSIGAEKTLESILKILKMLAMAFFLVLVFRGNYLYAFAVFLVLIALHGYPYLSRRLIKFKTADVVVFSFLLTIPLLHNYINSINSRRINIKKFSVVVFFFSFLPLVAMAYSVDKGIYLLATYLVVSPLLYFFFFHKSRLRSYYLASVFLGLLSGILLLVYLMRGGFTDFLSFTFLIIPKFRELCGGFVYPIFHKRFLLVCIIFAANTYWVMFKFLRELHLNERKISPAIKAFLEKYLIEFSLLFLSLFLFRSGLGRSDWVHVAYSTPVAYILSMYILIKHYIHPFLYRHQLNRYLAVVVAVAVILLSSVNIYRVYTKNLIVQNFPYQIPDSEFIPDKYKATIAFLKNNLSGDEEFFTLTSEASWYYLIDKPSPTRFPVIIFAMPYFYQNEAIEDLKKKNIKFILYENDDWVNSVSGFTFDGFSSEERLPLIVNYIKQDYVFFRKIDDNEIWIKKQL